MKKLLFVLLACLILVTPVLAVEEELVNLSDQQLLAVYDKLMEEIQRRNLNPTTVTTRDEAIVFGQNIHVVSGDPVVCLPNTTITNNAQNVLPTQAPIMQPTPTAPIAVGDKATYDSQTPADGVHVKAGQSFDSTWYLLNSGTTTWTTDYVMRYYTGTNFTKPGKTRYYLNAPVPPNTVGACSVDAVAPSKAGTYSMTVVLGNENEENFTLVDITIVVD